MPTSPEQEPFDSSRAEVLAPASATENLADHISGTLLLNLPNDLTRMIYLASLRDCNSGLYLHPGLSQREGIQAADRALRDCHEQVFRRLLTTRLPEYVSQLREYVRYTRGETLTMLNTWKSLQAYRATVPVGVASTSAELFFLNTSVAIEVLSRRNPELQ